MPFASSSNLHSFRSRSIPLITASAISISIYVIHTHHTPLRAESPLSSESGSSRSKHLTPPNWTTAGPYTPLAWGSNRFLTLSSLPNVPAVKKPAPLVHLGSTPLRDLVLAEQYGACVDAKGDCWMWGAGYDPSGEIGRSLMGKVRLMTL